MAVSRAWRLCFRQALLRTGCSMTTYFVTRHAGAREWAAASGVEVDFVTAHLDIEGVGVGDIVIGTLPVHLAAEITRRGARYIYLSIDIPADRRGQELSAEEMKRYGARLEEYRIEKVTWRGCT